MNATNIEWTDFSANLLKYCDASGKVVWHCEKLSPGCKNCYSDALAHRYHKGGPFNAAQTAKVTPFFDEKEAAAILGSKKLPGKRVFIDDMTDLFGDWVPDEIIDRHFAVFALRPDAVFQVLTKRPERMRDYLTNSSLRLGAKDQLAAGVFERICCAANAMIPDDDPRQQQSISWPLLNVWLGTSVEDQQRADERIPLLLETPAAVRFLSCEPLVAPIVPMVGLASPEWFRRIDWVIVGGESGPGARMLNVRWIRDIVRHCKSSGVPCFVKQLGSLPFDHADPRAKQCRRNNMASRLFLKDRKGGDPSEWDEEIRVRQFPAVELADA